jgi:hypothetical protein
MTYTGGYKGQLAPTAPEVSNDAMDNELASLRTGNLKKPYRSWKRLVMACTGVLVSISLILLTAALIAGLVIWIRWQHRYPDTGDALHWNWNNINLNDIHFPKDFLWFVPISIVIITETNEYLETKYVHIQGNILFCTCSGRQLYQ